jgi:cysteine synthase
MPSDQATEKSDLLLKLGAVVERVPPAPIVDPMHFVNRARDLAKEHTADPNKPGRGFFADQFETEANWKAHFRGTGPEIYQQCGGKVDAFVSGAGTGGTIAGVAKYLKSMLPDIKIVLADPQGSGLYNRIKFGVMFDAREREGTRRRQQVDTIVEGIGINRITANFDIGRELIDDAIRVDDEQALKMARWLVEKDGIFVGSSSAVNCEPHFLAGYPRRYADLGRCCGRKIRQIARTGAPRRHDTLRFWSAPPLEVLEDCGGCRRRDRHETRRRYWSADVTRLPALGVGASYAMAG